MCHTHARLRLLFVLATLTLSPLASADGIMFERIEPVTARRDVVRTPRQDVAFYVDGRDITVVFSTQLQAGPADVAWLVPVPAEPRDIAPASPTFFADLDALTAPQFFSVTTRPSAFGCGCAAAPSEKTTTPAGSVSVHSSGVAGAYAYQVLSATDVSVLTTWLTDNQYHLPDAAPSLLQNYVHRGYYWLAMRLRPDATSRGVIAAHPIRYRYTSDRLSFPLVISRMNTRGDNDITVHVIGDSFYRPENFNRRLLDDAGLELDRSAPSGTTYEHVLQASESAFFTEFAGLLPIVRSHPGQNVTYDVTDESSDLPAIALSHVTRLHATLAAAQMTRDLELAPDPSLRQTGRRILIRSLPSSAAAAMPLLALVFGSRLMPRRRNWRTAGHVAMVIGLLAFAIL